jgi:hypothetical protein
VPHPRVQAIGHHQDLKVRRCPFLRHDRDRMLVADRAAGARI